MPALQLIDTHAHIYGPEFEADVADVVSRAAAAGVGKIFLPATDEASASAAASLCRRYPSALYPMLGLHPEDLPADYRSILPRMERLLQAPHPFIGIGEVGLDFYWDASRKAEQIEAFRTQIEWSLHYHLPLMIHARAAQRELVDVMHDYRGRGPTGVFHCFNGTADDARELLRFDGFCLGIGGILTFKKSPLPQVLPTIPLERIVLETDSPYMAPVPHRGQRNEPAFVALVAERMAEILGTTATHIASVTTQNALRTFPLARK